MFCNVTGYAVLSGAAFALDTLASQAFGSKQYEELALVLQRMACFLSLVCIPIAVLWFNCESFLLFFQQDPSLSALAGQYVRTMLWGLWPQTMYICFVKYCAAQRIVLPNLFIQLIVNVVDIFVCNSLAYRYQLGFLSAPIATSFSKWLAFLLSFLYSLRCPPLNQRLPPCLSFQGRSSRCCVNTSASSSSPSTAAIVVSSSDSDTGRSSSSSSSSGQNFFHGWRPMLALALPGALMLCISWWCFEIIALLAGRLGKQELETYAIFINLIGVLFMAPFGLSAASAALIGNALGAGDHLEGRYLCVCSMWLILLGAGAIIANILLFREQIGPLLSSDATVIAKVAEICPLYSLLTLFDQLQTGLVGVLRGCGKQKVGVTINLIGFYVVGLPACYLFAFSLKYGVTGLYQGLICAVVFVTIANAYIVGTLDWAGEVEAMKKQISGENSRQRGSDNTLLLPSSSSSSSSGASAPAAGATASVDVELVNLLS